MTDAQIVFCTCGDREEAGRIARALVEERLAACVNVLPEIESVYRWRGNVESAREVLLLIKTTESRLEALRERLGALHSYEVPEVLAVPVAAGAGSYLTWLREQVQS